MPTPTPPPRYGVSTSTVLLVLCVILAVTSPYLTSLYYGAEIVTDNEKRVDKILRTTPLIDGHNDLPYLLRIELKNKIYDAENFKFWDGEYSV